MAASKPETVTQAEASTAPPGGAQPAAAVTKGDPAEATTTTATSGATVEPAVVDALPMDHPAIDSEPRKGLPPESSRIDMNDPY